MYIVRDKKAVLGLRKCNNGGHGKNRELRQIRGFREKS